MSVETKTSTAAKLWDRGEPLDAVIERFTVGRDPELDQKMVAHDALGSAAHAAGLAKIGILTEEEARLLCVELSQIVKDAQRGRFVVTRADEDVHTAIEKRLTAKLGDLGRKVHTGRSRNDQVMAMTRLYAREALLEQVDALLALVEQLLELANEQRETTIPGYSHTRQAMPSTLGLLFGAHAQSLLDDLPWLQRGFEHLNRSPLGSASGFGVALPLAREYVAQLLAFDSVQANTLAVQNDRGRDEFLVLAAVAATLTDLSRLAGDLIWFSTDELRCLILAAEVTTGSSIMPQKRNPDVLELIRATAARVRSRQAEIGAIYGSLSSGYHRDLQLTKEPFVEAMAQAHDALLAMQPVLRSLKVDKERCHKVLQKTIGATDVVYQQVAAGEPFRVAYKRVAQDPAGAVQKDPGEGWRARTHLGAPGALELDPEQHRSMQGKQWLAQKQRLLQEAWQLLSG